MSTAVVTMIAPGNDRAPAVTGVPAAAALVATRVALWVVVQLILTGAVIVAERAAAGEAINATAGWWMVYGAVVEIGALGVLLWLLRRNHIEYRDLLGPGARVWQVAAGTVAILVATAPAIFFSSELTLAMFGTATPPMMAIVDVPVVASAFSVLVWPLLVELVEPVVYLGILLPALKRQLGRRWLAAGIVVALWAAEHAVSPLLVGAAGIDLMFAAYRVISVLPFVAIWTALYYALGRRLLPLMLARWIFNAGTAVAVALGLF